jgi:hypothetical protein
MLSRIFWIGIAGIALVGGLIMQGRGGIISWGDDADHKRSVAHRIETKVDAAIDHSFDKMQVVGKDGEEIDVSSETKRELAGAVGRLVKAETDLAFLSVRDSSDEEMKAAQARRDRAKADVETLKDRIERQTEVADDQADAVREQIQADVRETVRDAVRN